MFTKDAIITAQEAFGGKNFPQLVKAFIQMGVVSNRLSILDGQASYQAKDGQTISLPTVKVEVVADQIDRQAFLKNLKRHQAGDSDFLAFCKDCAQAGVANWQVDLVGKTCCYFSKDGRQIYEEAIPV
ncbi:DUF1398 domain-containing protein [Streptococcus iniae]|uniref:DUF1398 domain-containing protein n=1 Tax=Streptococcus iniae TaxID=1346 RepID=A0ABN4D7M4_STRIN|nr:DUF1398 family protein [Streptococcus iniae]AGM98630.1 hypothetical protein K710_0853 [Streptococcus iniae SF1]AHY15657.1 hypothetical protein DQ08_04115 [Streptococcus iniae]AHY17525.1 hypothetical protein DW64_04105 [Streptococcus iniae]AJG25827.1 hypothetical protein SI82_04335 [Streptococcus iniae]APD31699.1 hypothetical protein BMF34_04210 [Streptococcus iniae]